MTHSIFYVTTRVRNQKKLKQVYTANYLLFTACIYFVLHIVVT